MHLDEGDADLVAADRARLRERLRKDEQPALHHQPVLRPVPAGAIGRREVAVGLHAVIALSDAAQRERSSASGRPHLGHLSLELGGGGFVRRERRRRVIYKGTKTAQRRVSRCYRSMIVVYTLQESAQYVMQDNRLL